MLVSKEEYERWEKKVRRNFFGKSGFLYRQQKHVVYASRMSDQSLILKLLEGKATFPKRKIAMWHIGEHAYKPVAYGWESDVSGKGGTFKFPATDAGGLTNVRLDAADDSRVEWSHEERTFPLDTVEPEKVFLEWQKTLGRGLVFPEEVRTGFLKWMQGAASALTAREGARRMFEEHAQGVESVLAGRAFAPVDDVKESFVMHLEEGNYVDIGNHRPLSTAHMFEIFTTFARDGSFQNVDWSKARRHYDEVAFLPQVRFGIARTKGEDRTVVPASIVKKTLGEYFLKTHNMEGEARRATDEEVASLRCAITSRYVTPNINASNMRFEYTPIRPAVPPAPELSTATASKRRRSKDDTAPTGGKKTVPRKKKGVTTGALETGWNVFTGGSESEVMTRLTRLTKPFYLSVDLRLSKDQEDDGTYLHFVSAEADVHSVPAMLASVLKKMHAFNDRAWVEGTHEVGSLENFPIWKLELGS